MMNLAARVKKLEERVNQPDEGEMIQVVYEQDDGTYLLDDGRRYEREEDIPEAKFRIVFPAGMKSG